MARQKATLPVGLPAVIQPEKRGIASKLQCTMVAIREMTQFVQLEDYLSNTFQHKVTVQGVERIAKVDLRYDVVVGHILHKASPYETGLHEPLPRSLIINFIFFFICYLYRLPARSL